ncbi:MAG: hypothetical protein DMD59_02995 [Gemmatimonadetes bacterium]|nr:MAG: hypothetical protein DMD59_02995 [Gemmatimonadota bacterium]
MRTGVVAVALAVLALAPTRAAHAQFSFDARRYGMGGVSLSRDGNVRRYNPAYRAVKNKNHVAGTPKFSIPVPFGLIQFFKDHPINQLGHDPMFDPKSTAFNPVALMDVIFNPPIFYEVKKAPLPTNDVSFTIGRNQLIIDLGATKVLIPEQEFGLGTTSRLLDVGAGFAGFHVGVMGFLQYDVGFTLDTTLRNFLVNDSTARPNTAYFVNVDGTAQAGFAPTVSYAGRLTHGAGGQDTDDGFYVGGALHYYFGATYGRAIGPAGFTTGAPPVLGSTPSPLLNGDVFTSNKPFGRGVGGDVGVVWISGPRRLGRHLAQDEAAHYLHRQRGAAHGYRHDRRWRRGELRSRHGDPCRGRAAHRSPRHSRGCVTRSAEEDAVRFWRGSQARADRSGRRILHA